MAQCHAERRKHPSAMDFYVGALHSKLYNPNKDVDKYPHWTNLSNTSSSTTSISPNSTCSSQSFRKESSTGSRPSPVGGSFRESALMVGPCSEVKSSRSLSYSEAFVSIPQKSHGGDAKLVQMMSPSCCTNNPLHREDAAPASRCLSTPSNGAPMDKVIASSTTKVSNLTSMKVEKEDSNGDPRKNAAQNLQPIVNETRSLSANSASYVASFPRSYKSAELGVPLAYKGGLKACNVDAGSRLYKSGEQISGKFTLSANSLKESPTGGLIVGSQKVMGSPFGDSFSLNEGSPTSTRDGPRWSSAHGMGSADLSSPLGGSPTSKDGGRKVSSINGSSDDGSSMAKDVQINEAKDVDRRSSLGSVLNTKDVASVRGMGNILVGASSTGFGKGKFSNNKAGVNDIKPGDGSSKKVEDLAPTSNTANLRGPAASTTCADGVSNRSLGNLCHGSRNSSAPSGNILNTGMASRTLIQQVDGTRNGFEPLDPEDIKNAGNVQYKLGHFSEAVALYDKSITICPNHAPYRSNRAAALAGLGRLGEAVVECEEAIKLDPQYLRAHQRAAHLYLRLGMIESSKRHLRATIGKDDTGVTQALYAAERHISRCIEARKAGDWKSVLQESIAAIGAGADSAAQVLGYKAEALLKLHRVGEADAICAEAQRQENDLQKLGVAPADSFLLMLRAHIEMYLGRFEGAIGVAEAAAKVDPRNMEVAGFVKRARSVVQTRTSGNELFNSGRFFEACAIYGEGLESDPMNAILLCNRAACRSKLGQWEKAIEDCDAALKGQPNYIKALMRRAHCSSKLERWEDALQDYEVLRAKMPSDMEVARGYFDVQVAIKKSRGEEIHKMKFGGEVEEVFNEGQLREVVTFGGVSVVQFITRWSDRCGQISPFIDQLCKRFPCVHFVKVDVEDNPYLAKIESVTFVPTFKIFRSGQRMKELQGPSEQALENAVKHFSL